MRQPRAFATVSGFGEQLLVAGGEYPIHESGSPATVFNATGEVYDPATGSFEAEFVALSRGCQLGTPRPCWTAEKSR